MIFEFEDLSVSVLNSSKNAANAKAVSHAGWGSF